MLVGSALCVASVSWADSTQALHTLISEYWQNRLQENPLSATYAGVNTYNDKLQDITPEGYARRTEKAERYLARLQDIDRGSLTAADQLNALLLEQILSDAVDLAPFETWRMPFTADSGFHIQMNFVAGATRFRKAQDYEDYLARLRAIPAQFAQHIENMQAGLKVGFSQPQEILEFVLPSFAAQVVEPATAHPLYRPFKNMISTLSEADQARLQAEAKKVMEQEVIPAFATLSAFMHKEYLPAARKSVGALDMPNGEAYYQQRVRYYTTLPDVDADDIHQLGLEEVARIRSEMADIIASLEWNDSFDAFVEHLRTDPKFYAKSPQQLIQRASYLSKQVDGRLPRLFHTLPRQPYSVEPVPADIAPNYTTGRYVGAPLGADRGGQYWVNTYALDKRPLYSLAALTLHESVPGHHLQIALNKEITGVPEFRRAYSPTAYVEGWGLYAEKLGIELDIYETPYDHFGRLSYEIWRACRLVIDTGLHAKGWSRQQAIDYLASNTALSLHNVRMEVDRYISWPGQALAYKMGELTLLDLRRKATEQLGPAFDIRDFHEVILLEGAVPLNVLIERVDGYIAAKSVSN